MDFEKSILGPFEQISESRIKTYFGKTTELGNIKNV